MADTLASYAESRGGPGQKDTRLTDTRNTNWILGICGAFLLAAACAQPAWAGGEEEAFFRQCHSLRLALEDLVRTFGPKYPGGAGYLARLAELEKAGPAASAISGLDQLRREALLANPLLDFDRLLVVKRGAKRLGLPQNWQSNSSISRQGYDNEIAVLSPVGPEGRLATLYRPAGGTFVGDVDLHFDAERLLFSMPQGNGPWQVHEIGVDGGGLRQVTPASAEVDNYDACYLPDGAIIFASTACMQGVPCVAGSDHVANLYRLDSDGKTVRQITFDQDHDWHPSLLNNGRVLYTRWEYSDLPHAFNRLLFQMNGDGTEQMAYYGSNSYWPNSVFYARAVPNHPTKVVGIVSGHHGVPRMGEMVIFDPAAGRHEADGAVHRIGSRGQQVEPVIVDSLVDASWPKFLHPWPLSEKYFLVSCLPAAGKRWGVYLADVFDNLVLICEQADYAIFEPVPLRPRARPLVIPSKVDLARKDAMVYLADVYNGPGLSGVPRGAVSALRVFTYHFAYRDVGGQQMRVGLDGPWDVKRVLGTVAVEADGSAFFRVPANTPISVQPLDRQGRALQLMRSWMTLMPGETLSCAGCHERQNTAPSNRATLALRKPPRDLVPWYGPTRGFSFKREVQPVLDKHCVSCHDGQPRPDGRVLADLRDRPPVNVNPVPNLHGIGNFQPAYYELRRFIRGPTMEPDLHLLMATEFHADTVPLVQMLHKGHYGVKLDGESWDRLYTWIDLNTPCHGTWGEVVGNDGRVAAQRDLRLRLRRLYAGPDEDGEVGSQPIPPAPVAPRPATGGPGAGKGKPVLVASAAASPSAGVAPVPAIPAPVAPTIGPSALLETRCIDLGGTKLELVRIPAGEFVMGDPAGCDDEKPAAKVKIASPFWMGRCEITNEQYRLFAGDHDSRLERPGFLHFNPDQRGASANLPAQPVVRVSWRSAMQFCRWLSGRTGLAFTLPTEAQWEYACRAGTTTPLWFGPAHADFARLANLADACLNDIGQSRFLVPHNVLPPYHPAVEAVDDGHRVTAPVGSYQANSWGLFDMHGNAAEWTRTTWRPYPYREDERNPSPDADVANLDPYERKVVRGGSWHDRPQSARSAFRLSYEAWQGVYDVGFRVVCPAG